MKSRLYHVTLDPRGLDLEYGAPPLMSALKSKVQEAPFEEKTSQVRVIGIENRRKGEQSLYLRTTLQ